MSTLTSTTAQSATQLTERQVSDGIARLRTERDALQTLPAVHAGRRWAVTHAKYQELVNWQSWLTARKMPPPGTREFLCHAAAWAAYPNLRLEDVGEAAHDLFVRDGGLTINEINENAAILLFVKAAIEILAEADAIEWGDDEDPFS